MKIKILELELIPNSAVVGSAVPGSIKLYANSSGTLRQIDESGNDTEVGNSPNEGSASITLESGGTIPSSSEYIKVSGITTAGIKEKFSVLVATSITDSDYFAFYSPGDANFYNMWYSVDGFGAAPSLGGIEIEIPLSSADSTDLDAIYAATVAALTALAIGITVAQAQEPGILVMYIEQGAIGTCTDATAGGSLTLLQINNQGAYADGPYKVVTSAIAIAPGLRNGQRLMIELVAGEVVLAPGTLVDPSIPPISERIWNGSSWLLL